MKITKAEVQELVKEHLEAGTRFQIEVLKDGTVGFRSADNEYISEEAVSSVWLYDYEDIEEAIEDLVDSLANL